MTRVMMTDLSWSQDWLLVRNCSMLRCDGTYIGEATTEATKATIKDAVKRMVMMTKS
jgi:hypothetical protein